MNWPYYTLTDEGYLVDDDGNRLSDMRFESEAEAEAYLVVNDLRGTVR